MNNSFILLGSNMGNTISNLALSCEYIQHDCGTIVRSSSLYKSSAWGIETQDDFLNQAIEIQTADSASSLLGKLLTIEKKLGRIRLEKWGPRTLDLDILYFNDSVINDSNLTVPHPELANRRFALVPLNEIAPDFLHPILRKTTTELLAQCLDKGLVEKIKS